MPTFEYQARSQDGSSVAGLMAAGDELALDRALDQRGLLLVKARPRGAATGPVGGRLAQRELVSLTTQLATLLSAGVPILQGLRGLGPRMRSETGRRIIARLTDDLQAGTSLSEALEQHPRSFDRVFRESVRAGELSGALPSVLQSQARFLEWSASVRSMAIQALFYPAMLCLAIVGLVLVMLTFVLPRIVGMMPGGKASLPAPTRMLMLVSDFLRDNAVLLLGASALLVGLGWLASRREDVVVAFRRGLLRVPRLGDLLSMLAVSRFARTASVLQDAGCDMLSVLDVAGPACGDAAYRRTFAAARAEVAKGESLSVALEASKGVDSLLVQMVRVGEDSGGLDSCLAHISDYYDKEVPRLVSWFLALLEPAILVVAGSVVAFILLSAILPMISLYESM